MVNRRHFFLLAHFTSRRHTRFSTNWRWKGRVESGFAPYGALMLFVFSFECWPCVTTISTGCAASFIVDDGFWRFQINRHWSLLVVAPHFCIVVVSTTAPSPMRAVFSGRLPNRPGPLLCFDFWCAAPRRSSDDAVINLIPTLVVGRGPEAAFCIREMRTVQRSVIE